jgi:glycosyltransferase involved in cell wall biosynthesis
MLSIPMKILIASFTFPPNKDGVSEACATLGMGFVAKGWEVAATAAPTEPARSSLNWQGVAIHEISISGTGSPQRPYQGDVAAYRKLVKDGGWDVILFQTASWPLMVVLDLLPTLRARCVMVSHGYAPLQWVRMNRFPWGIPAWLWNVYQSMKMPFWLKHIDRAVFLSERADLHGFYDHFLAKLAHHPGRRVIPNGVDPEDRGKDPAGFRARHGIATDALMFVCVANYSRRKDQGYAARAFRQAKIPGSVLVFIGSDFNECSAAFQAEDGPWTRQPRGERILWLEKQDRPATLDAVAAADIFVLSANHEAQPIALLEAMREAKPWIARKAGCIPEMPGGICTTSEHQMTLAMRGLAAAPARRSALGQLGAEAVTHLYNRKAYQEAYCQIIEEPFER